MAIFLPILSEVVYVWLAKHCERVHKKSVIFLRKHLVNWEKGRNFALAKRERRVLDKRLRETVKRKKKTREHWQNCNRRSSTRRVNIKKKVSVNLQKSNPAGNHTGRQTWSSEPRINAFSGKRLTRGKRVKRRGRRQLKTKKEKKIWKDITTTKSLILAQDER